MNYNKKACHKQVSNGIHFHRQWEGQSCLIGFVVVTFTILLLGLGFLCFCIEKKNQLCHSLASHRAAILIHFQFVELEQCKNKFKISITYYNYEKAKAETFLCFFPCPNISEKGAMPMDFSWELLFELLGKIADTIGDVLGGTKKD